MSNMQENINSSISNINSNFSYIRNRSRIVYQLLSGAYQSHAIIESNDSNLITKQTAQVFKFNKNGTYKVTLHFSNGTESADSALLQRSTNNGNSYNNIVAVGGKVCTCENIAIFSVTNYNSELYALYAILNSANSLVMVTIDIEELLA